MIIATLQKILKQVILTKKIKAMKLDYNKIKNVEIEDINTKDYPDFCDAYVYYAEYNGKPMTEEQLDALSDNSSFVHEEIINQLY